MVQCGRCCEEFGVVRVCARPSAFYVVEAEFIQRDSDRLFVSIREIYSAGLCPVAQGSIEQVYKIRHKREH